MESLNLFQSGDGSWVTSATLLTILENVKAPEASVLYVHSGLNFGTPNPEIGRRELLGHLFGLIASLGIPTICFPTFTFSFCNGEDYNVQTSRSKMGALNEYVRGLPETVRSEDPLMSSVVLGKDDDLVQNLGKDSIGANSTFDRLHQRGSGVKFLFFGVTVSDCFTYTHYVEERLNMPYRYNRGFSGRITNDGRSWRDTYRLFVRYRGVVPNSNGFLESDLVRRGLLRKENCGGASIACLDEPDGYATIAEHLAVNANCYIAEDPGDKNVEFTVRNMVSL
jgi:aminoglycoside 3-N-acetyltransferase